MRSEKEIMDLIINTAKEDDRIRAVIMNGSRTNPNVNQMLSMKAYGSLFLQCVNCSEKLL